jgi:hypothetical protein
LGKFKLSLKLGNIGYLHFFEENEDALKERIDSVLSFRDSIIAKVGTVANGMPTTVDVPLDFPTIERPSSQYDAIVKVVRTDWARKEPRGLNEIHSALDVNAIHIDKTALGSRLTTLTRQGKIRRVKRNGTFAYTARLGD